jgi:nicotinamidase-related amidase
VNTPTYDKEITALLVVDPYNDFISEGGKIWPRIKAVAEANNCVPHMQQVLNAAWKAKLRIFFAMHHRYRPGDYETWKYIAPIQKAAWLRKTFEYGTSGGEFRAEFAPKLGEISVQEHWCSSGVRQHRFGFTAQETWHSPAHCHRTHRAHLHRSDCPLCR